MQLHKGIKLLRLREPNKDRRSTKNASGEYSTLIKLIREYPSTHVGSIRVGVGGHMLRVGRGRETKKGEDT